MTFAALRLAEPILRAVEAEGYSTPTPIQAQAIPHVIEGRDVLALAQTGTGKTAAFALPILHRLIQTPQTHTHKLRTLILSPTRELATQIGDSFRAYGRHAGLRHTVIFGGVGQNPQVHAIRQGVDILVATPGRLMDLMNQGHIPLNTIEILVLDEADRMLDMGFIHDIRKVIAKIPENRQTLLFSATMPGEIRKLVSTVMNNPVEVRVASSTTVAAIEQFVYYVTKGEKPSLLLKLLKSDEMSRTLVFTRTKRGADKVVKALHVAGLRAEAIHGNKNQNARQRALASFKSQKPPVLVATDVASRGIDVDNISHVINYDVPNEPESYVHRIGRTGRAGASGVAFSFCDQEERSWFKAIEKLIRQTIPVRGEQPQSQPSQPSHKPSHAPHRPAYVHTDRPPQKPLSKHPAKRPGGGAGTGQHPRFDNTEVATPPRTGIRPVHHPRPANQHAQHPRTGGHAPQHPRTGGQPSQHPRAGGQHMQHPRTNTQHPRAGNKPTQHPQSGRGPKVGPKQHRKGKPRKF